ncbi:MAG: hypothetical protein SGILL_003080 [Bacillariaceae sp.]
MEQVTEFVSRTGHQSLDSLQDMKEFVVSESKHAAEYLQEHLPDASDLHQAATEEMSSLSAWIQTVFATEENNGNNPLVEHDFNDGISQDLEETPPWMPQQQQLPFDMATPHQNNVAPSVHSFTDLMRYNWWYLQHWMWRGKQVFETAPTSAKVLFALMALMLILWSIKAFTRLRKRRSNNVSGGGGGGVLRSASGHGLSNRRRRPSEIMMHGKSIRFEGGAITEVDEQQNRPRKGSFGGLEALSSVVVGGARGRFASFDFFGLDASRKRSETAESFADDPLDQIHEYGEGRRKTPRSRLGSGGGPTLGANSNFRRERLGSMDVYLTEGGPIGSGGLRKNTDTTPRSAGGFTVPTEPYLSSPAVLNDDGGEKYLYDEFGIVTLSHRVTYYGPTRSSFESSTYTPPTSWEVASRRIIPTDIMTKLERRLHLDLLDGVLQVTAPQAGDQFEYTLPLDELSMYIHRPLEGGVMSIYVKGTPKEEWMEHTFKSAHTAAQFQLDLLAYQVLGKTLRHIFEALNVMHQGSLAFDGEEYVLHDDCRESNTKKSEDDEKNLPKTIDSARCVAWDDVMRSLSSIPTVRIALERLWLSHRRPSNINAAYDRKSKKGKIDVDSANPTKSDKVSYDLGMITEEYGGKRLLLGPLDFYRLFVPALPDTAIPEGESNRERMVQLLSWRKRVARAAVLVRAYTRAKRVVNMGWNLSTSHTPGDASEEMVRRLAYDGNDDNNVRDSGAKNEIYEASVSRDVLCYVRPFDFLNQEDGERHDNLVLSTYQAYAHVGSHYFKMTPEMTTEGGILHSSRDPVEMFPSLRNIIEENPDLDFLIWVVRLVEKQVMVVHVHVRSLSKSIDAPFDNVVNRYTNGSQEVRDRKLYCMIQLGNRLGLSYAGWLFLRIVSFLFQLTETGRNLPMNLESTRDRYAFPSFKVASFFKCYHFGGAMQTNPSMPKNYIAGSAEVSLAYLANIVPRIMFSRLQKHLSDSIVDMTYFLEGDKEDELPERALFTVRQCHVTPSKVAKDPRSYASPLETSSDAQITNLEEGPSSLRVLYERSVNSLNNVAEFVTSPLKQPRTETAMEAISEDKSNEFHEQLPKHLQGHGESSDVVEKAIDAVIEILQSVEVPTRRKPEDLQEIEPGKLSDETEETGFMVMTLIPVLKSFDRHDIERFVRDCDFEIKDAAVRLVQTAAWRGRTFPLDKRRFRIELQNGQFFQQGIDKSNNPVFYFRNMCRGPWNGDADAAIAAVLYRLDKSLMEFSAKNPRTKATLIVLMGAPKRKKDEKKGDDDESSVLGEEEDDDATTLAGDATVASSNPEGADSSDIALSRTNNPRVSLDEHWKCHTSNELTQKLLDLLRTHYPGRLAQALIVKGRGKNKYYGTELEAKLKLKNVLGIQKVRDKVKFVNKTSDLVRYVAREELCTIVGGKAPVTHSSYEF